MFTVIALLLSQFVTPGCKPNQSCTLSALTVTNTGSITAATITGNNALNGITIQTQGGTGTFATNTSAGTSMAYGASTVSMDTANLSITAGTNNVNITGPNQVNITGTALGAVFNGKGVVLTTNGTLPTCDSSNRGRLATLTVGSGGSQLFWCDGLFGWIEIVTQISVSSAVPIATIQSRTLSSGVITTGNALLGVSKLPFVTTSNATLGTMNVADYSITQCGAAGTGAGNMVVSLRKFNNTAATVCSVNVPCTTTSTTINANSCNGSTAWLSSDQYGTIIDVSACTTAPTDCVVTHNIVQN